MGLGTKTWDKVWFAVFLTNLFALFVTVHDLDAPAGALRGPGTVWLTGLATHSSGWTLFTWASVANPFFEVTVRIQEEQGHHVIAGGPYAFVRHPGYIGLIAALGFRRRCCLRPGLAFWHSSPRWRL